MVSMATICQHEFAFKFCNLYMCFLSGSCVLCAIMENEEDISKPVGEKTDQNFTSEEEEKAKVEDKVSIDEIPFNKENIISDVMKAMKERESLMSKNDFFQHKLSIFVKGSEEKEYFQALDLPLDANEDSFMEALQCIDDTLKKTEGFHQDVIKEMASLEVEIKEKEEEWKELNGSFVALKARTALQSVNSDNGQRYSKEDVKELLSKEEEAQNILEDVQLRAIRKRYFLKGVTEEKKNLVEGPLDFGEYEIMCTETENNIEVVKQLKEEIKGYAKRSANVVNILSHLRQKLHSAQSERFAAEQKDILLEEELKEMRNELFQEKMKYANMNKKNEDLQHKSILLQHPRLIEDHKNLITENEEAKDELDKLKNAYKTLMQIIST